MAPLDQQAPHHEIIIPLTKLVEDSGMQHQPMMVSTPNHRMVNRKPGGITPNKRIVDNVEKMQLHDVDFRDDASDGTGPTMGESMDTLEASLIEENSSTQPDISSVAVINEPTTGVAHPSPYVQSLKLMFGAGGIYMAFLYNGFLQEDVFRHKSSAGDGTSFTQAWLLSVIEAAANVIVGFIGRQSYTCTEPGSTLSSLPQKHFVISGGAQVLSKSFKSLALANGLSFPIATLAKSGKMAPVMMGSLVLGGASYSFREYLQVAAIIAGTAIVSMGKSGKNSEVTCTLIGVVFILLSLSLDGVTGGVQKGLMRDMAKNGMKPRPYDMMYYTNFYMMVVAGMIALGLGEFQSGFDYIAINPEIFPMILKFSFCSAIGQSFIFFTIAHFDPLVCTTVTTTRKIFSVILSILFKGHALSLQGWSGVMLASTGIVCEVHDKYTQSKAKASKAATDAADATSKEPKDLEMTPLMENPISAQRESKEA